MTELNSQKVIELIISGDKDIFGVLYKKYRDDFASFLYYKYGVSKDDAKGIFTEMLLKFRENIVKNSNNRNVSHIGIKEQLFVIGKNFLIDQYRRDQRILFVDKLNENERTSFQDDSLERSEKREVVKTSIQALSEACNEILKRFYYQEHTIEKIQQDMGYKDKNSVMVQKSKCLKKLRTKVNSLYT